MTIEEMRRLVERVDMADKRIKAVDQVREALFRPGMWADNTSPIAYANMDWRHCPGLRDEMLQAMVDGLDVLLGRLRQDRADLEAQASPAVPPAPGAGGEVK